MTAQNTAHYPTTASTLPGWRWMDYAILLAALVLIMGLFMAVVHLPIMALFAASLVFMALGIRRPVFIICGIVIIELTILQFPKGVIVGLPDIRYAPIWIGAAVALMVAPRHGSAYRWGPGALRVVAPGVVLVFLTILATAAGVTPEKFAAVTRFFGTGLLFMMMIPLLIRDSDDLKLVGKVALVVFLFSAAAAISQHYPWIPDFKALSYAKYRSIGLSSSPIQAANVLVTGFLVAYGMLVALKLDKAWGVVFLMFTAIMGLAWYFTGTRSALFAVVAAVLISLPLLRGRVLKEMLVAVVVVGSVAGLVVLSSGGRYTQTTDKSAASREALWKVAFVIALDRPLLGGGHGSFRILAPQYWERVDLAEFDEKWNSRVIVSSTQVHNDFLRVWAEYGVLSLIAFLLMAVGASINLIKAHFRATDPWLKGASLGVFVALIGYLVNSGLHNYLTVTYVFWGLAGLSIALANVTAREPQRS